MTYIQALLLCSPILIMGYNVLVCVLLVCMWHYTGEWGSRRRYSHLINAHCAYQWPPAVPSMRVCMYMNAGSSSAIPSIHR